MSVEAAARASEATTAPLVIREDRDGVARLTLNRPAQRNALSMAMLEAMAAEIARLAEDRSVKAVIIAGNGPGFCGGHDLKEMRANPGRQAYEALFGLCAEVMMGLTRLPQPVIARVHGIATAAGCQLVATCDLAIAEKGARFAVNGINIGLFCSTPMVALTRAVGRKAAMEMLVTGDLIDAETAARYGLINRVVEASELDATVDALAAKIVAKAPKAVAIGKGAFYRQAELDLSAAYNYAGEAMVRNMLTEDTLNGMDAFIAKQPPPAWKGR